MDAKQLQGIRDLMETRDAELEAPVEFGLQEKLAGELAETVPALLDYIDALKAENARMRHDLETTDGLYASDKEDMSHSFRLEHASLRRKPEAVS